MGYVLILVLIVFGVAIGMIVHGLQKRQQAQERAFQEWLNTLDPEERRHQEMMRVIQQSARDAALMQMGENIRRDEWNRHHPN